MHSSSGWGVLFGADVLDVKPVTLLGRHLDDCSAVEGELIRKVAGGRSSVRLLAVVGLAVWRIHEVCAMGLAAV